MPKARGLPRETRLPFQNLISSVERAGKTFLIVKEKKLLFNSIPTLCALGYCRDLAVEKKRTRPRVAHQLSLKEDCLSKAEHLAIVLEPSHYWRHVDM